MKHCANTAHILMPKSNIDLHKWAVVACDQYTSQPDYWAKTADIVGDNISSLHLILPEVYLEKENTSEKIKKIHNTMNEYIQNNIFSALPEGMMLIVRDTGKIRKGLVLQFDLEEYDYKLGSKSKIRPTEKTVEERIPPRLAVRDGASIEIPHIMIMIDDPDRKIIEPLYEKRDTFSKLYDVELMQNGGHLTGWFIPKSVETENVLNMLDNLADAEIFAQKYNTSLDTPVLPFAVGDGNHSMATAKAYWEKIKHTLSEDEKLNHPSRFILAELVNIHDESIIIEPIHRILFDVDIENLFESAVKFFESKNAKCKIANSIENQNSHAFPFETKDKKGVLIIENSPYALPIASIQTFLDEYIIQNPNTKIDYIHGDNVLSKLASNDNSIGFFMPTLKKDDLFKGVIFDGVLPRKTFSMGDAREKRFYMEAKMIVK